MYRVLSTIPTRQVHVFSEYVKLRSGLLSGVKPIGRHAHPEVPIAKKKALQAASNPLHPSLIYLQSATWNISSFLLLFLFLQREAEITIYFFNSWTTGNISIFLSHILFSFWNGRLWASQRKGQHPQKRWSRLSGYAWQTNDKFPTPEITAFGHFQVPFVVLLQGEVGFSKTRTNEGNRLTSLFHFHSIDQRFYRDNTFMTSWRFNVTSTWGSVFVLFFLSSFCLLTWLKD